MSGFAGVLDLQVRTLTEALRRQQEARCRDIVAGAEHQARQAIRDSRRRLYERQRQAVREERQRREHELLLAKSRVETHQRRRTFAEHGQVLQSAWPLLVEELQRRWSDPAQRLAWCEMIVTEASRTLAAPHWLVEHPPALTRQDRDALAGRMRQLGLAAPSFTACDDIGSGLRIRTGTACLDGTAEGLLRSRADVEALLLAAWEQPEEKNAG